MHDGLKKVISLVNFSFNNCQRFSDSGLSNVDVLCKCSTIVLVQTFTSFFFLPFVILEFPALFHFLFMGDLKGIGAFYFDCAEIVTNSQPLANFNSLFMTCYWQL